MINKIWVIMRKNNITKEEFPFQVLLEEIEAKKALEWIKERESKLLHFEKESYILVEFSRNY